MQKHNPSFRLTTPVLFIVFNRPSTTKEVFEAIKKAKPSRLYIAADGPRKNVPGDLENVSRVRKIVSGVDWDCEVKTLFRDHNLNCGHAPATAISWFFQHESQGIILEDDCLPVPSFFRFCQELLERYRNDTRIMHIGGNNFISVDTDNVPHDYYFSVNGHIWGWATWRRAWQHYDFNLLWYKNLRNNGYFSDFFPNPVERYYRLQKFERTVADREKVDWWDYQWDFARFSQHGLSIVPSTNLVRNIGFGEMATHTTNRESLDARMSTGEFDFPLRHPEFVIQDVNADRKYFKKFMGGVLKNKVKSLIKA